MLKSVQLQGGFSPGLPLEALPPDPQAAALAVKTRRRCYVLPLITVIQHQCCVLITVQVTKAALQWQPVTTVISLQKAIITVVIHQVKAAIETMSHNT